MKKVILITSLLLLIIPAQAQLRNKVYVSYSGVAGADSISCIDGNSRTFSKPISLNSQYGQKLISLPGDTTIFIIDNQNLNLFKFRTIDNTNIKAKSIPYIIRDIKLNPSQQHLYFSRYNKLYKMDKEDLSIIDSFEFSEFFGYHPEIDFAFLNDSIVFCNAIEKVYKYNLNMRQSIDSLEIRSGLQYQYHNGKIYYGKLDTLMIIDLDLMKVTDSIKMNAYMGVLPESSVEYNGKLYFNSYTLGSPRHYFIETFNPDTKEFLLSIEVEYSSRVFISQEGNIWMPGYYDNKIYVYSISQKKIIDIISVNKSPREIIFAKGNNHKSSIGTVNGLINLKLYPNPATNKITLETSYNKAKKFAVINSVGKTVMSFESLGAETEVDVSTLPPGVYFMIPDSDKTQALKFIKQ